MATTTASPDGNATKEVEKTFNIVAYMACQDHESWRLWANKHSGLSGDFMEVETKTYEYDRWWLRGPGFEKKIEEEEFKKLQERDLGDMRVEYDPEVKADKKHVKSDYNVRKIFLNRNFEDVDPVFENLEKKSLGHGYENEDGDTVVNIRTSMEDMGMLKHPSEIEGEDIWEDEDANMQAVKFRITIKRVDENMLDVITNRFVEPFIKNLRNDEDLGRVRVMDCKVKTTEEGACYRI